MISVEKFISDILSKISQPYLQDTALDYLNTTHQILQGCGTCEKKKHYYDTVILNLLSCIIYTTTSNSLLVFNEVPISPI